ncbi:phosphodiester glycosidase family protein [Streptomyces sp. NA04227]|uniref:phosphodiester glycosidase family protein n=1 Tax=Streptomyces sp. NA04227 TaxID=2742136 RepID=UPI001590C984|nr:phosphodiester glycosidase family protein [Streptomyces sp. NA04227]QKW05146.1 phosphodiester glycosidase family protein [Streptomyces sp. NA04227]
MKPRTVRRGLVGAVTAACLLVPPAAGAGAAEPGDQGSRPVATAAAPLPLGPADLPESRTVRELAPGVTQVSIERGRTSARDFWTVTVGTGTTEAEVAALEQRVREAGFEPRRDATAGPDPRRTGDGPLGRLVRVGEYADQAAAQRTRDAMAAKGLPASVQSTGEDGHPTTGPWSLDALVIDPKTFRGRIGSELATGIVPGRETVSALARRTNAFAAVNGGYFVIGGTHQTPGPWAAGTDGDLAGVSVVRGDLVSEGVGDRPALVLPSASGDGAAVRRVRTELSVRTESGSRHPVTGLNRQSGLVLNCGGTGDAVPFAHPAHDYTCGNPNELVALTPVFGPEAPTGPGFQATLDASGRVVSVREERGGAVPARGTVLQGTGTQAQWLREHARPGARLTLRRSVLDAGTGKPVRLGPDTSLANGGPLLLRDGRTALDPVRDGWSPEDIADTDRAGFYNGWYLRRNPRTAAGVTADGRLILLTADGRRPGHSVGLSLPETAAVMRALGARNALNLDGGGSTAMVVEGTLQGTPSDATGERPDGDALVLTR